MEMSGLLQIEIILNIWNTLTTVSGDIVTNVDSLQIKSVLWYDLRSTHSYRHAVRRVNLRFIDNNYCHYN